MDDKKKQITNDDNLNHAPDKTIEEHQEDFVCSAEFEDGCKEIDS